MLGLEKDVFVIDTVTGKVYNLGEEVGMNAAEKQMQDICGPEKDQVYKCYRFIIISGLEWGVETFDPKTREVQSLHNSQVVKKGRHFSSY